MSGGIRFDNVIIGHDEAAALAFGKSTWGPKAAVEKAEKQTKTKEEGWLRSSAEVL